MKWDVPSCRELAREQLSVLEGAAERWPGDPGSLGKLSRLSSDTEGPFGNFPHLPCRFQDGCGAFFRICDLGGKPKPCLPTPGDSVPWALTGAVLRAKLPGLTESVGIITKGIGPGLQGEGILELRSPREMRSWKGYGLTDPVIHSFSKHS